MNKITILIATRNRIEKLQKTLASIPKRSYIETLLVFDGDKEGLEYFKGKGQRCFYISKHIGSVAARNLALRLYNIDGLLYATDDIIFEHHSIPHAFHFFNKKFPDNDGVVGFVQNKSFHPTGVALVGNKFLNRYPEKQLFYPKYYHFACQEILSYCETFPEKKFYQDEKAKIIHFHPCFYKNENDKTHVEARKFKEQDLKMSAERKERNLVWPISG